MVARTRTAAKAEQSNLRTDTTTQKAASKTKQPSSASDESAKVAAETKTPSPATKVARKTTKKATAKVATPTEKTTQSQTPPNNIDSTPYANLVAANYATDSIWQPNTTIPALNETDYATQKAQAEGQRRALEVASLNLENINSLHQLERQSINVAISAQINETHSVQLSGAKIDHQTQLEINGEKSQYLSQASAKHQAAIRETEYADQLISLKDQNFELEIQQAQNVFAKKAARYRAQLTGQ